MSGVAQQLKLRLFIEGVEVPVIAATVQVAPNSPAMCSIQIPPLAEGTRFLPRSLVHLFFLDMYEAQSPFVSQRGPSQHQQTLGSFEQGLNDPDSLGNGKVDVDRDAANNRYKLLFGGEVVGFGWTKNQAQRSLVLQCQDWSNYWDYAYQFNNTDLFGPGIKAMFSGGSTNLFDDFMTDEGTQIIQLLMTKSAQYPKLEGLLGGIVHLLESIGGSYYYEKKYVGQNMFYSLAELRLHISQMITAFPGDPTAYRLLGAGYDSLFGRTLGNLGAQVSFRQAINALMSAIFHETYAIPTPKYTPGTANTVSGSARQSIRKHEKYKNLADEADSNGLTCAELHTQLASEEKGTLPTKALDTLLGIIQKNIIRTLQVTSSIKELQGLRGFLSAALGSIKSARVAGQKYKQTQTSAKAILPHLIAAIGQFRRIGEFTVTLNTAAEGIPARLNQQIFRPDVWFAAPPRCNVLFPEHYTQLDYQRMFLQEPTRMLLKTNDEFFGEDELFDKFFFAPKVPTVKAQQKQLQAVLGKDLLPHELFTGILPVFEKMGELNIFSARTGWTSEGTEPKVGLAQRSVNFLYFKHRFASRSMSISARFNPYIAPGFPGLVIDKYVDYDNLVRHQELVKQYRDKTGLSSKDKDGNYESADINKLLGTHFLGNFTQVTHTVDQRSGRTDIQCGFPRQHDESSEFLGSTSDGQTIRKVEGMTALRATDVATLNPPRLGSMGPNYGIIKKITEVTDKYKADPATRTPLLPFYEGGRRVGAVGSKLSVPVGLALFAADYGPEIVALTSDPKQPVRFSAYTVEEEIPRYRKEKIDLGAEELIRPGWYGDCWRPNKIGEVYEHFFSTGAITDAQTVVDPGGVSTGAHEKEPADVLRDDGRQFAEEEGLAPALLMLDKGATVQQAVSFIVQLYSYVKQGGLDTDEFIRGYVWRPIATMVDMFGSSNLSFDDKGEKAVSGVEGFHSRAFGPHENLFGLVLPEIDDIVGIQRKKSATGKPGTSTSDAAARADVRKRRQDLVKEYVAALRFSRAIIG